MTVYRKYDHVERLGHDKVDGLTVGEVYVFPKLDGTNAVVWMDDGVLRTGSRNRQINIEGRSVTEIKDNAGFNVWAQSRKAEFIHFFEGMEDMGIEDCVAYGEWLVPHTLKTYREDSMRRFYIFDVRNISDRYYLHYEDWVNIARYAGLDHVEPQSIFTNPSDDQLQKEVESNTYLIRDGCGAGEGIVVKNYDWFNSSQDQPWGKIVRNEFREENRRAFGTTEKHGEFQVEAAIAEEFVTATLVEKTLAKIILSYHTGHDRLGQPQVFTEVAQKEVLESNRPTIIPRLLQTVYSELIGEEAWAFVKQHKDPTINFKKLRQHSIAQTKKYAMELF